MHEPSTIAGAATRRITRRGLVRLLGAAALATTPLFADTKRVRAGRVWCQADPILEIDGQPVDLRVSSYADMNATATGPTRIAITLPAGSEGSVLAVDDGFGGLGYDIGFETSRSWQAPLQVSVYQPAGGNQLPVLVTLTPHGAGALTTAVSAAGRANKWIALAAN